MKKRVLLFFVIIFGYLIFISERNHVVTDEPVYLSVPNILIKKETITTKAEFEDFVRERVIPIHRGEAPDDDMVIHVDSSTVIIDSDEAQYSRITLTYGDNLITKLVQINFSYDVPDVVFDRSSVIEFQLSMDTTSLINFAGDITITSEGNTLPIVTSDQYLEGTTNIVVVHDSGVLYGVAGTYSVRYQIIVNSSTSQYEKNVYRKVVIKKPVIPTKEQLLERFNIYDGFLGCKEEAFNDGNFLYIPGAYKDGSKTYSIKGVGQYGCVLDLTHYKSVRNIVVGEGIEIIKEYAFACILISKRCGVSYIGLPETLKEIHGNFIRLQSIKKVIIPSSLVFLENESFNDLPKLETVVFLNLVKEIEASNNYYSDLMMSLTRDNINIYFPDGVYNKEAKFIKNHSGYEAYNNIVELMTLRNSRHRIRYFNHYINILTYI